MENKKIVIVDDDQDVRESLQAILESQRYTVIAAANKEEGMVTIRAERPDLAILDLMMATWEDGFEMAGELKKDPDFKEMPILMLSGVKDQTGMDFTSAAGDPMSCPVDAFLDKPVEAHILLAEVGKLLSTRGGD